MNRCLDLIGLNRSKFLMMATIVEGDPDLKARSSVASIAFPLCCPNLCGIEAPSMETDGETDGEIVEKEEKTPKFA